MFKFGIRNLRRLKEVQPVEIRPLTLLLGRNSSGKSTFLRSLPLFRQSLMTRTSSPILWYGDLVDFGSYAVSITDRDVDEAMSFTFCIDQVQVPRFNQQFFMYDDERSNHTYKDITCEIKIIPEGERTRISTIILDIRSLSTKYRADLNSKGDITALYINESNVLSVCQNVKMQIVQGSLLPDVRIAPRPSDKEAPRPFYGIWDLPEFVKPIVDIIRPNIDGRVSDKTISQLATQMIAAGITSKSQFKKIGGRRSAKISSFISDITGDDNDALYPRIYGVIAASAFPSIMRGCSSLLRSMLSSILYIGPARARSERYYRYQDLSVSEIDPDGKNFPMFLNSLSVRQINDLSEWIQSLFGYGISVSRQTGHISINLVDGRNEMNLVDVGYGVSQILPVLAQIWWARARVGRPENRSPLSLLAIEQPELHLHPAHQALLADALVGEANAVAPLAASGRRMHYIVETHSETLVNRLGELVAEGRIGPGDVQILLFDRAAESDSVTEVRTVGFSKEGTLINWPYGFFQPQPV